MQGILDRAADVLERRFLKNAFLPVLLLPLAIAAPWAVQDGRLEDVAQAWSRRDLSVQIVTLGFALAIVWFLAAIVASQWRNIIRLYEGYPLMRIPLLGNVSARWYWRRAQELESTSDVWQLYYYFPAVESDFLPTRLGNVLRAAERYPYYRYGADTIVVWPRLYRLLERQAVEDVEDARASLEFMLVISLWFALSGAGGAVVLLLSGDSATLASAWFLAGAALAYLTYVSAIWAAVEYGEQLRTAMELYRLDLLAQLRLSVPTDLNEERSAWLRLTDFVGAGIADPDQRYEIPSEPPVVVQVADLRSGL